MAKNRKGKDIKSVEEILKSTAREPVPTSPIDTFLAERDTPVDDQRLTRKVLDLNDIGVIGYVAKLVILSRMNYAVAAKELFPKEEDWTVTRWATRIREHPKIQKEVEVQLDAQGLGDKAKQNFVLLMHEWLEGDDQRLQLEAAKILSRGYIGDKIVHDKPEALPIEGFDDGLKKMLGEDATTSDKPDEAKPDEVTIIPDGSQLLN